MTSEAATTTEAREDGLRQLDDRVRNNLSLLLALVRMHMDRPPASALSALSRIAGQIMALSAIYDITRDQGSGDSEKSAAELYARLIENLERELHPLAEVRLDREASSRKLRVGEATTLAVLLGEMVSDAIDRASRAGEAPVIKVSFTYEGPCSFKLRVADRASSKGSPLAAETLAKALGGEMRTTLSDGFVVREFVFTTFEPDGSCRDE